MDNPHDQLLYDVLNSFFRLADLATGMASGLMTALGLTHPLANVIWLLDPTKPAPSMREFAQRLSCDPSSLTFLADRLAEKGLLERQPDPENRRVKRLVLTKDGLDMRRRLIAATVSQNPFARLDVRDQQRLRALLSKAISLSSS